MIQLLDDFNYGRLDANDWTQIQGGSVRSGFTSGAHSLFFGGNGQRIADTIALNVSNGGTISFYLVFGDGSNGGENVDAGEDVVLEYSSDGGTTWGLINTYDSEDYTSWSRITENVPTAALSPATRFRWRQLDFDSSTTATGVDNWGLDHVQIVDTALSPVDGVFDDFNYGTIDWENWADLKGGSIISNGLVSGAHALFFGSSSDGDSQRLLESMPVDVSSGGNISFFLRFGDGDNGGDNADPGEDVVLEYSIDGGNNWTTLNTYDTEDYTHWTRITEEVPDAALGSATRFRWRQVDFSDSSATAKGQDNWSLDHIRISNSALESLDGISDDFNYGTTDWVNWADIKGGSVRSGFTSGNHSLFFGASGEAGGQRLAATNPVDVSTGGTVSFDLVMGDGNNGGANADPGEDVALEYSVDGGHSWILVNLYDSEDYSSWTRINENVPAAALSDATRFRLRQLSFDASSAATGNDNWGLDNFRVVRAAITPQTQVVDDFNYSTVDTDDWVDIKGGSVRSGFTTGAHSLYFGSSSDGGGQRLIESIPIDTKQGGNVGFYLVFGDGSNGGENADPGEDVVLEYSNDDGQTWNIVNTYDTEDYTSWTWLNEAVPAEAMTPSTSFRLRQVAFDNTTGATGSDNWGIDQFTITGAAQLPRSVIRDDFNYSTFDTDDWADIKGGSVRSGFTSGNHSLFFGSASDGGGQRLAEALPVDVRGGGTIQFDLVFGNGSNGGDNAEAGEDVVLEYSNNGGVNWTTLSTYDTEAYTTWTRITETIPTVAQSGNTSFRLRQVQFDASSGATGADNWGLDNFSIVADPLPANGDVDLVVEDVTLSTANGGFGGTTDVSWTVRNQGSDASDSQWSDRLYLSTDNSLSDDDIFLGTATGPLTALASGAAYTQTASVTLPEHSALTNGNYHVLVQADTNVNQTETDETNNVGSSAIALRNQWVDFSGVDIELQIFSPNINNPVTDPVQVTVSDAVEVTTESFTVFPGYSIVGHSFDISADSIFYEISPSAGSGSFSSGSFNGYVIKDIADSLPDFTNVTIDQSQNTLGLESSDVTFTANEIYIDVGSLAYTPGLAFELDVDFANVAPSPSSFIQPDTAVASSEYSDSFRASYTIDGSGIPDPLGPTELHASYNAGNHWISASGTDPREQYIDWGFSTAQTLDAIYLWNHPSLIGPIADPGYDVTLFDLTLFDDADNILLTLDDVALLPDMAAAQTFSFGQTVANVSRVRLDVENVQSSTTFTGLAEVGFNAV